MRLAILGLAASAVAATAVGIACTSFNGTGASTGTPPALDGSVAAADAGGFRLVSSTPADHDTAVKPDVVVQLRFSEPLDPKVDPASVALMSGADPVDVTPSLSSSDPSVLLLTPKSPLDVVSGQYTVSAHHGIVARSGATSSADAQFTFTLIDGVWSAQPETVAPGPFGGGALAVDDTYRRTVIYADVSADKGIAYGAWALPGGAWTAQPISTRVDPTQSLDNLLIAAARTNVVAFFSWHDFENGVYLDSYRALLDANGKWAVKEMTPYIPYANLASADLQSSPSAFEFALGYVRTVALQVAQGADVIDPPVTVEPGTPGPAGGVLSMAFDGAGDLIVGTTRNEPPTTFWVYRYDVGTAKWDTGKRLSANAQTDGFGVGASASGEVVAVWWEHFTKDDLRTSTFAAGVWSAPATLLGAASPGGSPALAVAASGEAVLAYLTTDSTTEQDTLWAMTRLPGGAFGAATKLDEGLATGLVQPKLAIDPRGNAVLAWQRRTTSPLTGARVAARYTVAGGWSKTLQTLSPETTPLAGTPDVAIDGKGRAYVLWGDTTALLMAHLTLP